MRFAHARNLIPSSRTSFVLQSSFLQFTKSGQSVVTSGKGDGEKATPRKAAPKKPSKKVRFRAFERISKH